MITMIQDRPIPKTEEEWRQALTAEQYRIMREKSTEMPFSGEYVHEKREGMYRCAGCGNRLFSWEAKFDSGTGWPSFDQALPGSVKLAPDSSHGLERTEVVCARCGSHLGHVFSDGPPARPDGRPATGQRYCINSVGLDLGEKR